MRGAWNLAHTAIVARALVLVVDLETDRRAEGDAVFGAGEDQHLVRLIPGGGQVTLAGAPATQLRLNIVFGQLQAGGAAINDRADRLAV